jgi:hypothetical protein
MNLSQIAQTWVSDGKEIRPANPNKKPKEADYYQRKSEGVSWGDYLHKEWKDFEQFALSNTFPAINLPEGEIEGSGLEILTLNHSIGERPKTIIRPKEKNTEEPLRIGARAVQSLTHGLYTRDEVESMFKKLLERAEQIAFDHTCKVITAISDTPYEDLLK